MATDVKNDANLSFDLVHYWKLEESSGARVDEVGTSDFTDNNTVGQGSGKQGNAANFVSANSEYLSTSSNVDFQILATSARSFSLWFKPDSVGAQTTILSKWANGDEQNWLFQHNSSVVRCIGNGINATGSTTLVQGSWYHAVVIFRSDSSLNIYLNNSLEASDTGRTGVAGSSEVRMGQHSNNRYFDGIIDELGWWNKELSTSEISDLYNSGSGIPYEASGGGGGATTAAARRAVFFGI